MSKREARSFAAAGVDVDAPRAKRRKEAPATSRTSPDNKSNAEDAAANGQPKSGAQNAGTVVEDKEEVRAKGLRLWQTLKDAVNKEGQIASFQFMRLPSKRQYADYYVQIKKPIALDDIKAKLDAREYASLEDVRQDLETCFRNAKRYNMKESQIWKDAKFLHKLTTKEFSQITGKEEGHDDGDGGSDDEGEDKKKKAPTIHRLLKSRLQKLVEKTDDQGRVLSTEFMELPSRKLWPMYYTIIKRPQCLENVFKKLKRKEYDKAIDFTNDVELVFSNALEFNLEHTQIWEDAVALREYFRKLMSDLPEPFSIPAYANAGEHPTKIRLKMPHTPAPAPAPAQAIAAPTPSLPSTNSITVSGSHVASSLSLQAPTKKDVTPGASGTSSRPKSAVKSPSVTPVIPPSPAPLPAPSSQASSSSNVAPTPALVPSPSLPTATPQAQKPAHAGSLQSATFMFSSTSTGAALHPSAVYRPPPLAPAPPKASSKSPALPMANIVPAPVPAPTPAPSVSRPSPLTTNHYAHPLKHVVLTTLPQYRRLIMDHEDGVRTWAMRLNGDEARVVVSNISFVNHEEDEESGDEEPVRREEEEEEEEDASPPAKKRGPGRPPRKRGKAAKAAKKSKGKALDTYGVLQVKLNGAAVAGNDGGTWEVQVPPGMSVLEVGEKGGMVWKVYLDRAAH